MRRIDRQIVRDVLLFSGVTCGLVLAILLIAKLSQFLNQVASGTLPLGAVMSFLWLALPALLATVLPIAFFFGVYLAFNRLYRSNEMVAIRSAGLGLGDLLRPVMGLAALFMVFEVALSLWWAPASERNLVQEANRLAHSAAAALLQPGSFAHLPGDRVVYVGRALADSEHRYQGVFVFSGGESAHDWAMAAFGEVQPESDGGLTLVLVDGRRYLGEPGKAGFKVLSFSRYRVRLAPPLQLDSHGGISWSAEPIGDLWALRAGPDRNYAMTELEWRLIWPFLLPALALLAVPIAYAPPRSGGRAAGVLIGVLVLLAFNNLLILAKERMRAGELPPIPGLWWVLVLLVMVGTYAFYRRARDLPMLPGGLWHLRL